MSDPEPEPEPEFELEQAYDREELAAVVDEIAAALDGGHTLQLHTPARRLNVDFPRRLVAELRAERADDAEPATADLELALEWDDPGGSSIRVETVAEDETTGEPDEPTTGSDDQSEDPAAAMMPPEAVTGDRRGESADEPDDRQSSGTERTSRFEVYQDRAGEWRWRLVHWNGNILADSGEGYTSRSNAKRAARGVMRAVPTATIEETES
ncbi:YegP family protein [Halosolutus halophilus]|uniref:amphi-Trp domain-containing protein n=1 Tax=Halosolutus halophilus TaxID=1552990 RepID=UPI002234F1BC|nr:YegP family protein [Halosolutus halophilus]